MLISGNTHSGFRKSHLNTVKAHSEFRKLHLNSVKTHSEIVFYNQAIPMTVFECFDITAGERIFVQRSAV